MNDAVISIESKLVKRAEDLRVFQKAFLISVDIHKTTLNFPKIEQYALADQMRRASNLSVQTLQKVLSSNPHLLPSLNASLIWRLALRLKCRWIKYAVTLLYINEQMAHQWHEDYDHIIRMLQSLKK